MPESNLKNTNINCTKYAINNLAHTLSSSIRTNDVLLDIDEKIDKFQDLHLSPATLKGLENTGFKYLTPIQQKAIPLGKLGLDLLLQSKAGTGKTCVFAVIALELIDVYCQLPQVLILVPSKEIGFQIKLVINSMAYGFDKLKVACFVGGYKIRKDENNGNLLKLFSSHIIIGTPSRIKHLIYLKLLDINHIKLFVMDEVDLVQEHEDDVNWIYTSLPTSKQMIITSATYSEKLIKLFDNKYMGSPNIIQISKEDVQLKGVKQFVKFFPPNNAYEQNLTCKFKIFEEKIKLLSEFYLKFEFQQSFVFCNHKKDIVKICSLLNTNFKNNLSKDNISAKTLSVKYISSNQPIQTRLKILNMFKEEQFQILVTSDVMARGIDIKNSDLVINFNLPLSPDRYIHRIGRCGRFGTYGMALTFISNSSEKYRLFNYIKMYNLQIFKLPENFEELSIGFITEPDIPNTDNATKDGTSSPNITSFELAILKELAYDDVDCSDLPNLQEEKLNQYLESHQSTNLLDAKSVSKPLTPSAPFNNESRTMVNYDHETMCTANSFVDDISVIGKPNDYLQQLYRRRKLKKTKPPQTISQPIVCDIKLHSDPTQEKVLSTGPEETSVLPLEYLEHFPESLNNGKIVDLQDNILLNGHENHVMDAICRTISNVSPEISIPDDDPLNTPPSESMSYLTTESSDKTIDLPDCVFHATVVQYCDDLIANTLTVSTHFSTQILLLIEDFISHDDHLTSLTLKKRDISYNTIIKLPFNPTRCVANSDDDLYDKYGKIKNHLNLLHLTTSPAHKANNNSLIKRFVTQFLYIPPSSSYRNLFKSYPPNTHNY